MDFKAEYDHNKFLELCRQADKLYLIENSIIQILTEVYHPIAAPKNADENIVPWFWGPAAMPLLTQTEKFFRICFSKDETPAFTGRTGNETVTIMEFAGIIQKKINESR